jgi:hypothetical protein
VGVWGPIPRLHSDRSPLDDDDHPPSTAAPVSGA